MTETPSSDTPSRDGEVASLLDDWLAEVGEEEVARVAAATRRDADAGRLLAFTDRDSLLAHWREVAAHRA